MRMAHIIMAYKDPPQIERLIKKLSHPSFDFYIHVDTKFDIAPFEYLANMEQVYMIKNRSKVRWAGFSFTKAVLDCMDEVLGLNRGYDFINELSGQDYPIVSTQSFYNFFEQRPGKNFFAIEKFGTDWWKHAASRIEKYHFTDFDFKGRYKLQSVVNSILPRRKFPLNYVLYGGNRATWWTINTETARYVIDFVKNTPQISRFARFTWAPDEFLIATIIMNSQFKDSMVQESYRYVDWSQGGANPKILTVADFDAMKNSNMLLARKFDIKTDTAILDMLDNATV